MKKVLFLFITLFFALSLISYSQGANHLKEKPISGSSVYNVPSFGADVFVFDPSMDMKKVQVLLDTLFKRQTGKKSEFNRNRYALMFKPGKYKLDIRLGYYMQVMGLGSSPEDVVIEGAVRSITTQWKSVLTNFWRSVENLTIIPMVDSTNTWGVSQAAPMRRVHIKGNLNLFDIGYASGGFLADSKIDGTVNSGPQQQWFSRNTQWGKWTGANWNMFFMGIQDPPSGEWPEKPYTVIKETPLVREKPFITITKSGYEIQIPELKRNSSGPGWINPLNKGKNIPITDFYIAKPETDNSTTINSALSEGKNLLITPGIYSLEKSLKVTRKGTVIIGLGMPTLLPANGNTVLEISDVDGISVCGLLIDAGAIKSETLLSVGEPNSRSMHSSDPAFLYDIFFRVGGQAEGSAHNCMTINSNNVFVDHVWLWRADHGNGVGWDKNRCANGLIVNGDDVTIYGLFNEHFQEYQTLWNGNKGRVYFYQSEMPYDPPTVSSWNHDGVNGYASYKVSDGVKSHEAWGLGIYNVFYDAPVIVDNAIETPSWLENSIHHKIIFWLNGNKESIVKSIINGKGDSITFSSRKATME